MLTNASRSVPHLHMSVHAQSPDVLLNAGIKEEFVGGGGAGRWVSVFHSHSFGLEVFHESVFTCGRDGDVAVR